ncbi:MAG TPA: MBG domain-containing protein, partial [Gammaproteobacteria bacterium]
DPDAGHVYAGLDSANTAVWGTAALDPVAAPGNRYVFAYRPTVDIVLSDRTKTYGDELVLGSVEGTDFTLSGAREGVEGAYEADTAASIFGGTMTLHSSGAAANADVIAGGYAITADTSGLTLNGYDLGSVINGTLTVDPRSISLGAAGTVEASRVYDGTTDIEVTSHGVLSDIVAGDDIGVRLAAAYQDKNVGRDKTVTGTYTLTGADAGNYVLDSSVFAATADITPAPLSVIARAAHKVYGESDPDFAYEVGGFVLGEDDSLLTGSLSRVEGENVGDYAITVGSLSAGGNYEIVYTGADLTITPRTITITADDQSRALGQADPRLTWSITGGSLASFDTIDTVFSGDLIRDPGEGVGEYAIRQGSLAANANYDLTFIGGTLHITPVAVTEPVVLERHAVSDDVFAIVQSEGGTDLTVCRSGVLGPDCAPFVSPDNRNLGPYIGWTGQSAR